MRVKYQSDKFLKLIRKCPRHIKPLGPPFPVGPGGEILIISNLRIKMQIKYSENTKFIIIRLGYTLSQ